MSSPFPPNVPPPWWTNTRLQSVRPGFPGAFPIPPPGWTVPVRVMGSDPSDEELSRYAADGNVVLDSSTQAGVAQLTSDAWVELVAATAFIFDAAGALVTGTNVAMVSGPTATGWTFATGPFPRRSGISGATGNSERTLLEVGRLGATAPGGIEAVQAFPDQPNILQAPVLIAPGRSFIMWTATNPAGAPNDTLRFGVWWREL